GRPRLRWKSQGEPRRRASPRRARGPDARSRRPREIGLMAVLDRLETLAPIREKVLAGERLDFDDGVALMETDDLLALGDLADLALRQRGGSDDVYFVQNINLYQTNVCRVKCKFCAFAKTRKQEDAFT